MAANCNILTVKKFYGGSTESQKYRKHSNLHKKRLKTIKSDVWKWRIPSEYQSRLLGPTVCWETFYRQKDAFDHVTQKSNEDLCVFAYEKNKNDVGGEVKGQRQYLVTSCPVFWHYYRQLLPSQRHHYEIIAEGQPVKLYFDLEYMVEENPMARGVDMVDMLVQYVTAWLTLAFGLTCDPATILDLDASTHKKFSRHLIFQNVVFENNVQAGHFVRMIFDLLLLYLDDLDMCGGGVCAQTVDVGSEAGSVDLTKSPDATVKESTTTLECRADQQCSDSTLSDRPCTLAEDKEESFSNSFSSNDSFDQEMSMLEEDFFHEQKSVGTVRETRATDFSSLLARSGITGISATDAVTLLQTFSVDDLKTLQVTNKDGASTLFCDLSVYTKNRNFRLYLSSKLTKNNPLEISPQNRFRLPDGGQLTDEEIFFASLISHVNIKSDLAMLQCDGASCRRTSRHSVRQTLSPRDKSTMEGAGGCSPFPEVDSFIESLVSPRGGGIRRWSFFKSNDSLIYDIVGYRWCANIGREHKSNNIFYLVDLRRLEYHQRCHDAECRGFRSMERKLPDKCLPQWEDEFDENTPV